MTETALIPTIQTAQVAVEPDIRTAAEYLAEAKAIIITSPDDRTMYGEFIQTVKGVGRRIEAQRVKFTGPLNTVLREINLIFKRPISDLETAEAIAKEKCLAWDRKVEADRQRLLREAEEKARKEQDRLNKIAEEKARKAEAKGDVDKAEMLRQTVPQVVIQAPVLPEAPKVAGEATRKVWKARVVDPGAFYTAMGCGIIPFHMADPNLQELARACPRPPADPWPGVVVEQEEGLATRAR